MNWVEINGAGLRYELTGQNLPPVVLIHEMGGSLETWDLFVPLLNKRNVVLRYDMRGSGMSEKIREDISVETLADDLHALLQTLNITTPVVLVGCAVGAAVAICFAGKYKELSGGLVALSPSIGVAENQRQSRLERLAGLEQSGMRMIVESSLSKSYPVLLREQNMDRFLSFKARWLGNDPTSFLMIYRMLVNMDLHEHICNITCPSLVVGGLYDEFRPPESTQDIAKQIPKALYKTLETGHHMPVQSPELLYEALIEFLDHVCFKSG